LDLLIFWICFAKIQTQSRYLREVDKIKTLIAPTIMGDKFKTGAFF